MYFAGALLKTAFICANIVDFPSEMSLKDQLLTKYGGGFELHTWSNLPHGSGSLTYCIHAILPGHITTVAIL